MGSSAEELILKITGDSEGGQKALADLEEHIGHVANSMKAAVLEGMGPMGVAAAALAATVAAAGAAMIELGQHATEVGAEIEKIALTSNLTAPAISQLGFAMDATGGSVDQLNTMLFTFEQRMVNSSSKVSAGLEMIGLSLDKIEGMAADQQILAISDAFRQSGEEVNRSAASIDIFGRQGRTMLPEMMQNLSGLADKAKDVANWTDEDAKKALAFKMASRDMATTTSAAWDEIGKAVAPATNEMVLAWDRMKLAVANVALTLADLTKASYDTVTGLTALTVGEFSGWLTDVMGKLPEVAKGLKGLKDGSGLAAKGLQDYTDAAKAHLPVIMSASDAWDTFNGMINADKDAIGKAEAADKKFADQLAAVERAMAYVTVGTGELGEKMANLRDEVDKRLNAALAAHYELLEKIIPATRDWWNMLPPANGEIQVLASRTFTLNNEFTNFGSQVTSRKKELDAFRGGDGVGLKGVEQGLQALSREFSALGQISGGTFGNLEKQIGAIISAFNNALKSGSALSNLLGKDFAGGKFAGPQPNEDGSPSTGQKAFAAAQAGVGMIASASDDPSTAGGVALNDAAKGAQIGSIAGPYGMAVGAAIGLIVGIIKGRPEWAKASEDVGRDFGVKISEALAKEIAANEEQFGGRRVVAEMDDMSKIVAAAGGVTAKNFDQLSGKLRDVFPMIKMGWMSTAEGTKILDENWQQFVTAGTDGAGRLNAKLKEMITLDQQFGTGSKAITDYLQGQGSAAITGFNAVMTNTKVGADGAKQALHDLGTQAVASFAAAVAAGVPVDKALAQEAAGLSALNQQYADLGLSVDDVALKNLLMQNTIVQGNPSLMAAIAGLSSEMVALDNMGLLNADTFGAMERTGEQMYAKLQAGAAAVGGDTKDALLPMQDYLHKAADEATLLGVPLDENTQSMVEQSKALGLWKDKGKDANAVLTDGLNTLNDTMKRFLDYLGQIGPVPAPWANWGPPPSAPGPRPDVPQPDYAPPQAMGGNYLVTKPTWFLAGEAGTEYASFSGAGKKFGGGGMTVNVDASGSFFHNRQAISDLASELGTEFTRQLMISGGTFPLNPN